MRLDLFSEDDTVLLLGEGNFSFSVCLHKHKLPIKIFATCLETEAEFEHQRENMDYLKFNKVPVFLNVDATKLRENPNFSELKFSKIVFNFPHVGGKMKIHLNRELLRKVFENCSTVLADNGRMIVSLCQGQGGTPADRPQRRWHDSWQITEMAAHGDFVLTSIEPFFRENFTEYRCIGYRSQDIRFHLNGALVHVFAKRKPPYDSINGSTPTSRLSRVALRPGSNVFVPIIYCEIYGKNPISNPNSSVSFLMKLLLKNLSRNSVNAEWKVLKDDEMPFHVRGGKGVPCQVNGVECNLRVTAFDVLSDLLQLLAKEIPTNESALFLGTYFRSLTKDFSKAPMQVDLTITGKNILTSVESFLKTLICLFEAKNVVLSLKDRTNFHEEVRDFSIILFKEFLLEDTHTSSCIIAATFCVLEHWGMNTEVCIIHVQALCEHFFKIGWRELWADQSAVVHTQKPIFKPSSLYPSEYKFDVTLKYREVYSEERLFELLWLAAGELIQYVELVSEYSSGENWKSKCYRLTYKSLDKPLFRSRVVDIHSRIVARVLELGMNVTIG